MIWLLATAHAGDVQLDKARAFTLQAPERWHHHADRPPLTEGWLVQLRVDPELAIGRQLKVPTLFSGTMPVMRTNWDHVGGCVVAVVHGPVDLTSTPLYYGSDVLPALVTTEVGRRELEASGAKAAAASVVKQAIERGGPPLTDTDLIGVHRAAADWIEACSSTPQDTLRVRSYRGP